MVFREQVYSVLIVSSAQRFNDAITPNHIEKQAMDRCVPRREIALGILKTYT